MLDEEEGAHIVEALGSKKVRLNCVICLLAPAVSLTPSSGCHSSGPYWQFRSVRRSQRTVMTPLYIEPWHLGWDKLY